MWFKRSNLSQSKFFMCLNCRSAQKIKYTFECEPWRLSHKNQLCQYLHYPFFPYNESLVLSFPSCPGVSPSVLPSSPLVSAVGRRQLKLSKRQVEQVQHSSTSPLSPSLSRTFPTHTPSLGERERHTQRDREEGKQRHSGRQQWEKTERCWLLVFFRMIHLTWENIHGRYNLPAHHAHVEGFSISFLTGLRVSEVH